MSQQHVAMPAPANAAFDTQIEAIDLSQLWLALRSRWRWIAVPALIVLAGSFVFVTMATPRYTAEAKLLLESRDSFYTRPGQERDSQPQIDEQAVLSQVQVVMSRDLAREAIRKLGLVGNPEFDPMVDGAGMLRRAMMALGLSSGPKERPPEERLLQNYFDRLLVFPVGKSRIVSIEFRSRDPELAARAANTVAELYLDTLEAAKKETARSASTWLGASIDALRGRVSDAEAKVEAFRARTGLLTGSNNATIATQQLSDLSAQLAQARSARADAEAKAGLIRDLIRAGRAFEIPDVANNELIRRLVEQRIGLRAQLALERRTLLAEHPRIKELNAQLADLEAQIRGAAERTVRTLENDARIAGSRVETLQAAVDAQKRVVAEANENEVQLRALEREAKAQRDQLEAYLVRYREAMARDAENATPADARIISRAVAPLTPSFPKKGPIMALSTLAAIVMAAGAIVARELLGVRPSGTEPASVPAEGGPPAPPSAVATADRDILPPLSADAAPGIGPDPEREAATAGGLLSAHDYESLIARLSRATTQDRGRRVLVTAPGGADRAAAVAHDLGAALARTRRALLLKVDVRDADADRPGLTDLVAGEASFFEIIERDARSRLHVVDAGSHDAALLVEEPQAIDIAFEAFDQTYDWVVCLLRDPGKRPLAALLARHVDAAVIVSNDDPASEPLVALYDLMKASGAPDVVVAREAERPRARAVAAA